MIILDRITTFIWFISLSAIFARPSVVQPGIRIAVSQKALQKAINYFLPELIATAKTVVIPGASTKHYSYDAIHFSAFNIGSVADSAINDALSLTLNKISVAVPSTTFHVYDKILGVKISCHGEITASIQNTNMSFSLKILDNGGMAQVQALVKYVQFGSVKVSHKFHSVCKIVDKVVEVFIGDINKKLEDAIKKEIPDAIQTELTKLAVEIMKEFVGIIKVDKYSELDYTLVTNMITPKNVLTLNSKGEFKSEVKPKESTLVAPPMPIAAVKTDICLQINEYVLNTAAEVYTNAGAFEGTELYSTTAKLNKSLPIIGPLFFELCPTCNVSVNWGILTKVQGGIIPVFNIKNGSITLIVTDSTIDIDLVNATKKFPNVIKGLVNITASVSVSIDVSQSTIVLKLGLSHFDFAIESSILPGPPIDPALFNTLINLLLKQFVVPLINSKLHPIPLPSIKEISLVNPVIAEDTQHITIQTDIKFK